MGGTCLLGVGWNCSTRGREMWGLYFELHIPSKQANVVAIALPGFWLTSKKK